MSDALITPINQLVLAANTPAGNVITADADLASEFLKRLLQVMSDFEDRLDQEHDIGIRLVSFGQSAVIHVNALGYINPNLIRFYGTLEDGSTVELVQHVSQVSFLLVEIRRQNPEEPKQKKFGFITLEEDQESAGETA